MNKFRTSYKPIEIQANAPNISSDGGLLLLEKLDKQHRLTERAAACLRDRRCACIHTFGKMLAQRVYGIAMGWEDCNDFEQLRTDPLYTLALGSPPASQPTLSRFENEVDSKGLYRMSKALVEVFIERYKGRPPKRIVLDIDATVDPAHGQQQFDFFNGFYKCNCYLPLLVFGTCDGAPMEILAAVLRPGNSQSGRRAAAILRRLAEMLREAFPSAKILVRADAGFAWPEFYGACEDLDLQYLIATESYKFLKEAAEPLMVKARLERDQTNESARFYGETPYKAYSWKASRRVIIKAEALAATPNTGKSGKDNARFVVTNLHHDPKALYEIYCLRGESENRIKEMKLDLFSGRTSCCSFMANAFRLMLHALAFSLLSMVRDHLSGTNLNTCTVGQIRLKLLKIGTIVEESTRRFLIRLARGHPYVALVMKIAAA